MFPRRPGLGQPGRRGNISTTPTWKHFRTSLRSPNKLDVETFVSGRRGNIFTGSTWKHFSQTRPPGRRGNIFTTPTWKHFWPVAATWKHFVENVSTSLPTPPCQGRGNIFAKMFPRRAGAEMFPRRTGAKMFPRRPGIAQMFPRRPGAQKMFPRQPGSKMFPRRPGRKMFPRRPGSKMFPRGPGARNVSTSEYIIYVGILLCTALCFVLLCSLYKVVY